MDLLPKPTPTRARREAAQLAASFDSLAEGVIRRARQSEFTKNSWPQAQCDRRGGARLGVMADYYSLIRPSCYALNGSVFATTTRGAGRVIPPDDKRVYLSIRKYSSTWLL